jgi:hypothetical protein
MSRDFTLGKYDAICAALTTGGYASWTMGQYLARPTADRPARLVLLRHDVESSPAQALRMADVERARGLVATYFFRVKRRSYDLSVIAPIAAMGHEIGYHYETLSQARGDMSRAVVLFHSALQTLRAHAPVRVASMHGSPMLPWDNRAIWSVAAPADFGLAGEVYRDVDYGVVRYFSDTGRTWHPHRYNVRDRLAAATEVVAETSDQLIAWLAAPGERQVSILTHPERWPASTAGWAFRAARDFVENVGKVAVAGVYRGVRGAEKPRH